MRVATTFAGVPPGVPPTLCIGVPLVALGLSKSRRQPCAKRALWLDTPQTTMFRRRTAPLTEMAPTRP
eukprot:9391024-Lingulodinium_polyedra.AAC.1